MTLYNYKDKNQEEVKNDDYLQLENHSILGMICLTLKNLHDSIEKQSKDLGLEKILNESVDFLQGQLITKTVAIRDKHVKEIITMSQALIEAEKQLALEK